MNKPFKLDFEAISNHPRVQLMTDDLPIQDMLQSIEHYINECFVSKGIIVVQHGRVIAIRPTDADRLSSAFKAAVYLGKYNDMANTGRFLKKMVKANHSYEPIRGESVMFLYIGVGKPVYDHLVTYSVGRTARIAAGQRANAPWGFETPLEARDVEQFNEWSIPSIKRVIDMTKSTATNNKEQLQAARSLLPVGYIMPPFLYEYGEEALVNIFKQRLWQSGAQGATKEIVQDMYECMKKIDEEKWEFLRDYHGTHTDQWKIVMRHLREKRYSVGDMLTSLEERNLINTSDEHELNHIDLYDALMTIWGDMPVSMWDKK